MREVVLRLNDDGSLSARRDDGAPVPLSASGRLLLIDEATGRRVAITVVDLADAAGIVPMVRGGSLTRA